MNLKFLTLCVAASFSCISTAEVLENTETAAPDYYDESYNREDDGPIAEDTALYGIVSQDGEKNIFTRPETVKLKAGSGSITEFAEEKDLSHSSADRQSAQGEYHYRRHGNDYNIKYNFAADSPEEVASMVDNFYTRMLSQYKSDEITDRYGNISQPKFWYEDTTPGEIHEGTVEGKRALFESKFTGNARTLKAYYPTNKKDNKWWRVIHPVEYYAMTADPQYPWLVTEAKSRDVILEQYSLLNTLKKTYGDAYRGTIINGDLTAFGHDWQWKFMKQALGTFNHPYWYGLGNHDYDNNVNNCALHENRCAIRSVRNLVDHINSAPDVQAVDYSVISGYKRAALDTTYTGSFSYSFDIGGIRFIQSNFKPGYVREIAGFNSADARRYTIHVQKSDAWLEEQMAEARKKGKAIILLRHASQPITKADCKIASGCVKKYDVNDWPTAGRSGKYNVTAMFVGHTHNTDSGKETSFTSPATFQGKFLLAEVDYENLKLNIYEMTNKGDKTLIASRTLLTPAYDYTIKERQFILSLKNKGGYVGYYTVQYKTKEGKNFSKQYKLMMGNTAQHTVPQGAKEVSVRGVTGTGRSLYNLKLTDYKNTCLETWGTLPKNLHWGHCG